MPDAVFALASCWERFLDVQCEGWTVKWTAMGIQCVLLHRTTGSTLKTHQVHLMGPPHVRTVGSELMIGSLVCM